MAKNLQRLRESFGISRKCLSKITGIPYRTLQNWELGTREMAAYEYDHISYRLSERKHLLKALMSNPVAVNDENCWAKWFSDKNGYGYIADIYGTKHKVYSEITVCYEALTIIPIWAQWTIEELIEEEKWERVINRDDLQANAQK